MKLQLIRSKIFNFLIVNKLVISFLMIMLYS